MKQINKITAAAISAAIISFIPQSAFAEGTLTETAPNGSYTAEAKRIAYTGEKAEFSVDIPADRFDVIELSDGSMREIDDGSKEYELFYGENENGYISCVFHQGANGYEGEVSSWNEVENTVLYTGTDSEGQPYCVAEMNIYGFTAYLADYPLEEDSWLSITLSFPESEMDAVRDDVIAMMGTFSRNAAANDDSPAETDNAPAEGNESVPDTGVAALPIAVPALAAGAMLFAKKRK